MTKYRTKPVTVSAFKWDGSATQAGTEDFRTEIEKHVVVLRIGTKDGIKTAFPGDYIVTAEDGEKFPVAAATFEADYETVSE